MVNDTIADLLTRIRNAQLAGHPAVRVPVSKMTNWILEVLRKEGFIAYFERVKPEGGVEALDVGLKYFRAGVPLIASLRRVSTPGRRIYMRADHMRKVRSGLGVAVLSTSQGVMSDREARRLKIGGEVLAIIA